MTEVDRMGKFHKAIELQGSGTFLLAVNIVGHGAPTEHTEAEPGMIYMDVDSEDGDLYKCLKVTITEQGSIYLWKKLVESQELEILKKEIATKANKTGWTANKYLGTDADGNMVEKEAPQTGTGGITAETDPTVPAWAKEPEKPTYTASEVGALPASTEIPANTSDLNNDSGYITIAVATLLNYYLKTEVYAKAETYSQTEVDNLISGLDKRLNAIADSEDVDLDQFSELVAYIKANKSLIDSITTSKVNVADIIDNLTTADSKKPLSAAQGKALKAMYDALPAWAKASTKPTYTKSEVGLGNVDNVRQYSASNPPPYPVKSVNGKTGEVTLGAADVGAATAEQFGQLSEEIADYQGQLDGKQPVGNYLTKIPDEYVTEVELEAEIDDLKAQGVQQTPLYPEGTTVEEQLAWLEENGDKTKVYVLEDGYVYGYAKKTTTSTGAHYKNQLESADGSLNLQINKRWSLSSGAYSSSNGYVATDFIDVSGFVGKKAYLNQPRSGFTAGYARIHYFDSSQTKLSSNTDAAATNTVAISETDGISSWTIGYRNKTLNDDSTSALVSDSANIKYMIVVYQESTTAITTASVADYILTVNEEIKDSTITETVEGFVNTGRAFVPADYEGRIIELEAEVAELSSKLSKQNTLGLTEVFAPSPQLPADGSETADFNAETMESQNIYDYMDALAAKYPRFITKETMGKDESGEYDWNRYVCCRRNYDAWQKTNYPKMWAWVNGPTTIYSRSVSPRIGDTMYSTDYVGTVKGTVATVDNANQTRTVGGVVYARDKAKDVEPTLVFTNTDYSAYYSSTYVNYAKEVYDNSLAKIGTISALNASAMTDSNGNSYTRYPLGDRDYNFRQPEVIVVGGSEHGGGEPREPAIIAARMAKDLCECKNADNALLNLLKNNYMIVFCPILNPWGFSESTGFNANGVNIDRNFDTPGWGNDSASQDVDGDYGGSENETQYFMNTVSESRAKIAVANHALGTGTTGGEGISAGFCHYMLGRNNSKYTSSLKAIKATMNANYNLAFTDYGEAPPEKWGKTRSYIDWAGAVGGAVEMQAYDGFILAGDGNKHTARIMEADYTLALQFLHMLIANA